MPAGLTVLSRRALNRALLQRQHLLVRRRASALEEIEHLVGMQAQVPSSPYVGLWSRLEGFRAEDLSDLIMERRAVRLGLQRNTVHLVSSEDCLRLRPLVQPLFTRSFATSTFGRNLAGLDPQKVLEVASKLLSSEPLTLAKLGEQLQRRWPDHDAASLGYVVRFLAPVVQVPPRGLWRRSGLPKLALAEDWIGRKMATRPSLEKMVLRYLAAFGPATPADATAWSGVSGMREVFERLRPRLRIFRDERGRELFDIPDGPLPDPDTYAPPRFLPEYDNLLLGHEDRTRVIAFEHRYVISSGTFLLDGFVAGTWKQERNGTRGALSINPFKPLRKTIRNELEAEAERLVAFNR
ncbi:MAG TPA: winged helix DNA-binding domain-containing protein [Candidatus Dormibacteraeota bacterium]